MSLCGSYLGSTRRHRLIRMIRPNLFEEQSHTCHEIAARRLRTEPVALPPPDQNESKVNETILHRQLLCRNSVEAPKATRERLSGNLYRLAYPSTPTAASWRPIVDALVKGPQTQLQAAHCPFARSRR